MMAARNRDRDDEELRAFGSLPLRDEVRRLKNNDPEFEYFELFGYSTEHYSDREWELLGRYIADNDHLRHLYIRTDGYIGGAQLSALCRTMVGSRSIETLLIGPEDSDAGISLELGSIQSLVPFIENSPNLTSLDFEENPNIDSRCFRLLMRALDGGPIKRLCFGECSINDITALGNCTLPRLDFLSMEENGVQVLPPLEKYTNLSCLNLNHNNIGKEGCILLAKLLENENSSLTILRLYANDINEEAAKILAGSLKHNTTRDRLNLGGNPFKEAGCSAFLKVLNDTSAVETTYNSNHTLQRLWLPIKSRYDEHIDFVLEINRENRGDSHAIGRAKIVATQLNSETRRELCRLQGIEYSLSNLLSDVEPPLLPDLLALTGREHGRSELYLMLIASAPDLTSLIDKRAMLKELIAQNMSQIAYLTSENLSLNQRLEAFTLSENTPPTVAKGRTSNNGCGNNKKRRSASS